MRAAPAFPAASLVLWLFAAMASGEPGAGQFQPGGDLLTRSSGQERHGQQSYLLWLRTANLRLNIQAAIEQFLVHHFGGCCRALMLVRAAAGQIANGDVAINTLLSKPIFSKSDKSGQMGLRH